MKSCAIDLFNFAKTNYVFGFEIVLHHSTRIHTHALVIIPETCCSASQIVNNTRRKIHTHICKNTNMLYACASQAIIRQKDIPKVSYGDLVSAQLEAFVATILL